MKQLHIYFSGSVQGVGFRFTAERFSRSYGIKGWVRNLPDERVEMVAQGEGKNLELYIQALKSEFDRASVVLSDEPPQNFERFEIR